MLARIMKNGRQRHYSALEMLIIYRTRFVNTIVRTPSRSLLFGIGLSMMVIIALIPWLPLRLALLVPLMGYSYYIRRARDHAMIDMTLDGIDALANRREIRSRSEFE